MKKGILKDYMSDKQMVEAFTEPVTEDGGLAEIGKEIQAKIDNGTFNDLTNKDLIDYYIKIVSLSGNEKLVTKTRVSLTKKNRGQLQQLVRNAAGTAIRFGKL